MKSGRPVDPVAVRSDLPLLRSLSEQGVSYLDNAATTPIVQVALDAVVDYYHRIGATPYRGGHRLTEAAAAAFESARAVVADYIGATRGEVIFVRNTTEAINLVAHAWTPLAGGEVVVESGEHLSNLLPWRGRGLRVVPSGRGSSRDPGPLIDAIGPATRLVAIGHASNVTGIVRDPRPIIEAAHRRGAAVLLDAAQTAPHGLIDVGRLGCDFLTFSGHKLLGPRGVGVLFARADRTVELATYQVGGGVVDHVTGPTLEPVYKPAPWRFEAGTWDVAGVVGLAAALTYLRRFDVTAVREHTRQMSAMLDRAIRALPGLEVIGPEHTSDDLPIVSFATDPRGVPLPVLSRLLDERGVIVRHGNLCAGPLLAVHGRSDALRASAYLHNDADSVAHLLSVLREGLGLPAGDA